jgi:phosphoribosylformylglycinamidine synthase
LFAEELGAVIQVEEAMAGQVEEALRTHSLGSRVFRIGRLQPEPALVIEHGGRAVYSRSVASLNRSWSELTHRMQALRDNPPCAREEFDNLLSEDAPGLRMSLTFDPARPARIAGTRPRMAILREQGVNGQIEMAAAFDRAGFDCVDVHMTDLLAGRASLRDFSGFAACGGFSYGDVLGAGSGWAKSILFNEGLREMFAEFFRRTDAFALGVCNGCQMISQLRPLIPGAEAWPAFVRNRSEQFEARLVTVEILESPSVLLKGMEGSRLAIPVAHGEGRAEFGSAGAGDEVRRSGLASLRFVDNFGAATERYPFNPNGSPGGMTGFTTPDGRVTILMPHPERAFRAVQLSYCPSNYAWEEGPWLRMFQNAREFVG